MAKTCEPCVKKAYQLCGGLHNKCDKGQGKNGKMYKATLLKSIIPTITPGDDLIPKNAIVNWELSDKEEYRVCCFLAGKIKAKLATIRWKYCYQIDIELNQIDIESNWYWIDIDINLK